MNHFLTGFADELEKVGGADQIMRDAVGLFRRALNNHGKGFGKRGRMKPRPNNRPYGRKLEKTSAFGQQHAEADANESPIGGIMSKLYGPGASSKAGPIGTKPTQRNPAAPAPLTTPMHMTDVASKM
jgi:hypothetical protein